MPTISEELYRIDEALSDNSSVEKLIEIIQPTYMVPTESTEPYACNPEIHQTEVNIGKVNNVILGIWPEEGPVRRLRYANPSGINHALDEGLLVKDEEYTHDTITGKPMIQFSLTKNQKQLKKHGLDNLLPGHAIFLYLEPRKYNPHSRLI